MFVIPAAGPGETHVPDMLVLDGVVSGGPQDATARQPRARSRRVCFLGNGVIEREVGPGGLEPARAACSIATLAVCTLYVHYSDGRHRVRLESYQDCAIPARKANTTERSIYEKRRKR